MSIRMTNGKKYRIFCMICLMGSLLAGCRKAEPAVKQIYAMDTVMNLSMYTDYEDSVNEEILDQTVLGIQGLDAELSAQRTDSPVYMINQTGEGKLGENGRALLKDALEISEMVGGALDVTIYPLVDAWGFPRHELTIPSDYKMEKLLDDLKKDHLHFSPDTGEVSFGDAQYYGLDFGAIAKGYAADRVIDYWKEQGVNAGIVSLGGNLQCFGTKPDRSPWICGITDPFNPNDANRVLGILKMKEGALVTSGPYQRYLTDEKTGETYHHILDPKTGYPADKGLLSATIYAQSGTIADGLSTAVFVLGKDQAVSLWRESATEFEMILMTEDQMVYITSGIAKDFTSDYPVEVIER